MRDTAERLGAPLWVRPAIAGCLVGLIALDASFSGGVFSSSLFIGAMLGNAFGIVATQAIPKYSTDYSAYPLVGMGQSPARYWAYRYRRS